MQLLRALLLPFAGTVAAEGLVAYAIFRKPRMVYYTFLCNLLTNPALNTLIILAVRYLGSAAYAPAVAVLELAVLLVEARVLRYLTGFSKKRAFRLSLLLNAASYITGLLIQ